MFVTQKIVYVLCIREGFLQLRQKIFNLIDATLQCISFAKELASLLSWSTEGNFCVWGFRLTSNLDRNIYWIQSGETAVAQLQFWTFRKMKMMLARRPLMSQKRPLSCKLRQRNQNVNPSVQIKYFMMKVSCLSVLVSSFHHCILFNCRQAKGCDHFVSHEKCVWNALAFGK